MGKGHRDNHAARLKRGPSAFEKKAERREPESRCNLCGRPCRSSKLEDGLCPMCLKPQAGSAPKATVDPADEPRKPAKEE